MKTNEAIRLLELANEKRHWYVDRDSKIHNYGGKPQSTNGLRTLGVIMKGATGPFTLEEAKCEAVVRFETRLKTSREYIQRVTSTIHSDSRLTDEDFLPFEPS